MTDTGKLTVRVYTGQKAYPVSDAGVSVLERQMDGSSQLLSFRKTNADGNTAQMDFAAPPEAASLTAGAGTTGTVFTALDVLVDRPGYYSVFIEGVQIFSGQSSLQTVEMIPLPESTQLEGANGSISFVIPAQEL